MDIYRLFQKCRQEPPKENKLPFFFLRRSKKREVGRPLSDTEKKKAAACSRTEDYVYVYRKTIYNILNLAEALEDIDSYLENLEYRKIFESRNCNNRSEDATYDFHGIEAQMTILYYSTYLSQILKITTANEDPLLAAKFTVVNGRRLGRTSVLTIGSKFQSDVTHITLLMHAMPLINFNKDYYT